MEVINKYYEQLYNKMHINDLKRIMEEGGLEQEAELALKFVIHNKEEAQSDAGDIGEMAYYGEFINATLPGNFTSNKYFKRGEIAIANDTIVLIGRQKHSAYFCISMFLLALLISVINTIFLLH